MTLSDPGAIVRDVAIVEGEEVHMRDRSFRSLVVLVSSIAVIAAGLGGSSLSGSVPVRAAVSPPLLLAEHGIGRMPVTAVPGRSPGQEPAHHPGLTVQGQGGATPGRVEQLEGQAGYAFDTASTISLNTTVTVPTVQCSTVPAFERDTQPGLQLSLEIGGQYVMVQSFCAPGGSPGSYQQYNYLNVLLTGVPYQSTGYRATFPGAQVELAEAADASSLTASITAPGFTQSWTVDGSWTGSAFVGALDYLENPAGGVPAYSPVSFASTTVDGSSLGGYLGGIPATSFAEQNSVFGETLQDQTSDIGSGDSFTITNANLTLPTVSVSTTTTGVERPSSGTATITFTVALSFASSSPVYLDYGTQDDGAVAEPTTRQPAGHWPFPPVPPARPCR